MNSTLLITSKSLKHLYDKRTARVYDFLLNYLHHMVQTPDLVLGSNHHKARFAIVKYYGNQAYYCSIESTDFYSYIVTAFIVDEKYLAKQKVIATGGAGRPSSPRTMRSAGDPF